MEEVSADAVVSLDLSRRALPSLAPWLSPPFPGCAPPLEHLEALDASRNALCGARGLEHLPRLRSLNLYFNRIEQLAELLRLRPAAGTLQALDLRLNPVARLEGYRRCVPRAGARGPLTAHVIHSSHPLASTLCYFPSFCAGLWWRCCPRWRCWTRSP